MSTSTGYVALLRTNRGFRLMWAGQFISLLGDSFNSIATIGLALAITGGSGLSVGLMLALRTVPRLLFSNVAGVWADRYDRRCLLITLDLLLAVATLGYLLVREPSYLWLLYTLSMLMGALAAAFGTVRSAFVPDVVGKEVLVTATGLTQVSFGLAMLLGCALGGLAIAAVGRDAAFVINAASFALSAVCTWLVRTRTETEATSAPAESRSFRRDLAEGTRYLRGHPFLAGMIAVDAMWTLGGGGMFVILAMLNRARFGGGDETMGLLYAMAGLGGLLAAALRPLIGQRWNLASSDLDPAGIVRQMARVTGPGGTLLSVEPLGAGFDQEKWTRLLTKAGFEVNAVKRFFETETSRGETEHHALAVSMRRSST